MYIYIYMFKAAAFQVLLCSMSVVWDLLLVTDWFQVKITGWQRVVFCALNNGAVVFGLVRMTKSWERIRCPAVNLKGWFLKTACNLWFLFHRELVWVFMWFFAGQVGPFCGTPQPLPESLTWDVHYYHLLPAFFLTDSMRASKKLMGVGVGNCGTNEAPNWFAQKNHRLKCLKWRYQAIEHKDMSTWATSRGCWSTTDPGFMLVSPSFMEFSLRKSQPTHNMLTRVLFASCGTEIRLSHIETHWNSFNNFLRLITDWPRYTMPRRGLFGDLPVWVGPDGMIHPAFFPNGQCGSIASFSWSIPSNFLDTGFGANNMHSNPFLNR